MGLFGSVNVEAKTAEWYRSQVTAEEMALATAKNTDGTPKKTPAGQPILTTTPFIRRDMPAPVNRS